MKKLILISMAVICGLMINSCSDSREPDQSLTGSIAHPYSIEEMTVTLDGESLTDFERAHCNFFKRGMDSVDFVCEFLYGEYVFRMNIYIIQVAGQPYDVTLLGESTYSLVRIYETGNDNYKYTGYERAVTKIEGWMKEETGNQTATRTSYGSPSYDCDITINCTIEGKELELRITKLE